VKVSDAQFRNRKESLACPAYSIDGIKKSIGARKVLLSTKFKNLSTLPSKERAASQNLEVPIREKDGTKMENIHNLARRFLATEGLKMSSAQKRAIFLFADFVLSQKPKRYSCPKCGTILLIGSSCPQHGLPAVQS